ncbi:MAG: DNA cytosine methyltransferase, partial [Gemmataceae bacterium]|nr:DNA cytosine methyltransferase [Gemmataceae bacterium]
MPNAMGSRPPWTVIDFFSGAGGMSCGFARRPPFRVVAAVDAEAGKPCEGFGKLGCNPTYEANIGVVPFARDISSLEPHEFLALLDPTVRRDGPTVFLCCAPCTDFSRAKPANHGADSAKNSLIGRCADFVEALRPEFVLMENARELIRGNHPQHFLGFRSRLHALGYEVAGEIHTLTRFGLPQIRERALVVASRIGTVRTLGEMWELVHRVKKIAEGAALMSET